VSAPPQALSHRDRAGAQNGSSVRVMLRVGRIDRVRRVVLLCNNFARNVAFYRAGWSEEVSVRSRHCGITHQSAI
jgi:hypothetical protein